MISHKHKVIFIHIPKCAGSSIFEYFHPDVEVNWRKPNYNELYGWCPERKIHLQHATAKQLIEMDLISKEHWKSYFKFTIVRNPWDRSYSDYLWMKEDTGISGSFTDYITRSNGFKEVLSNKNNKQYRGDHLLKQTDFFSIKGDLELDFVGHFESLQKDMNFINDKLKINKPFNEHKKKSRKRFKHYSLFYNRSKISLVESIYSNDIEALDYKFEDNKRGIMKLKNYL